MPARRFPYLPDWGGDAGLQQFLPGHPADGPVAARHLRLRLPLYLSGASPVHPPDVAEHVCDVTDGPQGDSRGGGERAGQQAAESRVYVGLRGIGRGQLD